MLYPFIKAFKTGKIVPVDEAPAGRKDGKALYKVNPDYYDKSKSRAAAQVVAVTYWFHSQFCADWVQSFIKKVV